MQQNYTHSIGLFKFDNYNKQTLFLWTQTRLIDLWDFMPSFVSALKAQQLLKFYPNTTKLVIQNLGTGTMKIKNQNPFENWGSKSTRQYKLLNMFTHYNWSFIEQEYHTSCYQTIILCDIRPESV